jgi:hypothetical protein
MGLARVVTDEQRAVGDASDRLESEELAHRGLRGGGLAVFEPHGTPGVDCHWVRPLGSINAHDLCPCRRRTPVGAPAPGGDAAYDGGAAAVASLEPAADADG